LSVEKVITGWQGLSCSVTGYVADSELTPMLSPKYFINIRDEEFYG